MKELYFCEIEVLISPRKEATLSGDSLPTTKERFAEIETRLRVIDQRLGTEKILIPKQFSFWVWFWKERNWTIAISLILISAVWAACIYVAGLAIDKRIQSAVTAGISPIQTDIRSIDGDTREMKGILGVLQAQVATQKFSTIKPSELKPHAEELNKLKNSLAQTPPTSAGYWPTAFQVIQLASQSTFADWDKIASRNESEYSNVTSVPVGAIVVAPGSRVVLKNHIEGLVFRHSIIRFDLSVELKNDVFIDCVFILPLQDNPPQRFQEIGKTLLASNLSNVTLNIL